MPEARAFILSLAVLLSGCENDLGVDNSVTTLPAVVTLHVGESVRLPREGCTVTFNQVTQDSRCPVGECCLWEGDAAARFTVQTPVADAKSCTLHTTLNPKSFAIYLIAIRLKGVGPDPRLDTRIDSLAYVATLAIDGDMAVLN